MKPLPGPLSWQPLVTEAVYRAGTGLAGDRSVKSLHRYGPVCFGWLQPAGFPGSGVVLYVFSRLGAPQVAWPFSFYSPPPHPPLCNLWELKLLQLRFPTQDLPRLPPLQTPDNQPLTSGISKPPESIP